MAEQSRVYGNFRGVDFTSDPAQVSPYRFSHCVNMWKDYESQNGIAVETFPGYRRLATYSSGQLNGIHTFGNKIYCHIGEKLCRLENDSFTSVAQGLANSKSTSFVWGDYLYILDGTNYWRFKDGDTPTLTSVTAIAYIPIAYLSDDDTRAGKMFEQKNVLASKYSIGSKNWQRANTDGITFGTTDIVVQDGGNWYVWDNGMTESIGLQGVEVEQTAVCATNVNLQVVGNRCVFKIPNKTCVGGDDVTCIRMNPNLSDGWENVTDIVIPSSIKYWFYEEGATWDNDMQTWCVVDESGTRNPLSALYNLLNSETLQNVWFEGTEDEWDYLKQHSLKYTNGTNHPLFSEEIRSFALHIGEKPDIDIFSIPVAPTVQSCSLNGLDEEYEAIYWTEGSPIALLYTIDIPKTTEKVFFTTRSEDTNEIDRGFLKCTLVQSFNGNLFFSGSPAAPSKIWWCAAPKDTGIPNPTYIGEFNFYLCGLDDSPIVSMMAQSSVLTVFKQKSDQDATIYYYSALQSESDLVPSILDKSEGGSGIACIGSSCNFLDDAVFLSKRGLEGIQKTAVNLERSVVHRSSFVDAKLQTEDLSSAWLLEWKGYLCVLFPNGHMYLADSRRTASGNEGTEYEWFYVEGLRGYGESKMAGETPFLYVFDEGTPVYAYADEADLFELSAATETLIDEDGCITLSNGIKVTVKRGVTIDDIASKQAAVDASLGEDAEVYSTSEGTQTVYYTKDGYLCYPSGEYADESGEDITCAAVIDDVLYFGAGGALYCINTDKREGDTIPNEYYTFCGRRYKSGFVTFADNCGVPHLRKKIIKKSLVVKTKSMDNSKFYLKVGTDRVPFNENEEVHTSGTLDFGALKFDTMDLFDQDKTIVPFRASAKKFVEAQLMLYSDGFKRPFGVYNMAFRFEVTGRVKE